MVYVFKYEDLWFYKVYWNSYYNFIFYLVINFRIGIRFYMIYLYIVLEGLILIFYFIVIEFKLIFIVKKGLLYS